jgi:hypothetical protein
VTGDFSKTEFLTDLASKSRIDFSAFPVNNMKSSLSFRVLVMVSSFYFLESSSELSKKRGKSGVNLKLENDLEDAIAHETPLAEATNQIITKTIAISNIKTVNLISFDDSTSVDTFKSELLLGNSRNPEALFHLENVSKLKKGQESRHFSIFIMQSLAEFSIITACINSKDFKFSGFYLFIPLQKSTDASKIDGKTYFETQKIFKKMWQLQIYNVNVLHHQNNSITLQSFSPFQEKNCNDTTPRTINEFRNGKFQSDQIFPVKMKSMNRCPIRVAFAIKGSEPFVISKNTSKTMKGRDVKLVQALAESLNFTIDYILVESKGNLLENGSTTGLWKSLANGAAEFSPANSGFKPIRLKYFDATTPYADNQDIFIIPPPKDLTSFEKLFLPFQIISWGMIAMCFVVGSFVIWIVGKTPAKVRRIVFGDDNHHPQFNLFKAFIGESHQILPMNTFARFLLALFMIYSLLIRTMYQGSVFKILQSNLKHKEVQSLAEMIEKGFNFYGTSSVRDTFIESGVLEER